jgi:hypothetical protein
MYPIVLPFSNNQPITGISSPPTGALLHVPRVDLGPSFAGAVYTFFLTGTSTPTPVYTDGALTAPFTPTSNTVTADAFGRFPAIYLDNSIAYKVTLTATVIPGGFRTTDPYNVALATTGSSSVEGIGLSGNPNTYGEYTLLTPSAGGSGVTLTLNATSANLGAALAMIGSQPGTPLLIVNNSVTTGAQTATFAATNKPGTATSAPVGWLPIECDGVLYYIPLWFDNNFSRYGGGSAGAVQSQNFNVYSASGGASIDFMPNGTILYFGVVNTGGSNWFAPTAAGIGSSYWLQFHITSVGGGIGSSMTINGTITSVTTVNATVYPLSSSLTIAANGVPHGGGTITGTYAISSSVTMSPIVGSGSLYLDSAV